LRGDLATNQVATREHFPARLLAFDRAGAIVGLIVLMYAYVFPGAVPHGLTIVK